MEIVKPKKEKKNDTYIFNDFLVITACVCLWMLYTTSYEHTEDINATVWTEKGTESLDLSCGKVPEETTTIMWFRGTYELKKILKIYFKTDPLLQYYNNYSRDKYGISIPMYTSLVVKNIVPSDTGVFKCTAYGRILDYSYTTLLMIMGKSLFLFHQYVHS